MATITNLTNRPILISSVQLPANTTVVLSDAQVRDTWWYKDSMDDMVTNGDITYTDFPFDFGLGEEPSMIQLSDDDRKDLSVINGFVPVLKFGKTNLIDTGDPVRQIWDRDHDLNYIPMGSCVPFYISSSNAGDTNTVSLIVMDDNGEYDVYNVALQGQTDVLIHPTKIFCRCIRAKNVGPSYTAGNVYIHTGGSVAGVPADSAIQAWFSAANGQTLMTHFTTPGNYYGVLKGILFTIINQGNTAPTNADLTIKFRGNGGVFLNKGNFSVDSYGTSMYLLTYPKGRRISTLTDIVLEVNTVGRNSTGITAELYINLWGTALTPEPRVFFEE